MVAKNTTSCKKIPDNIGSQRYHSLSEKIPKQVSYHSWSAKIPFTIPSNPEKWERDHVSVSKDTKVSDNCGCPKRPFSSPKIPQERSIIAKWKVSNHCWSPKIPFSSQKIPDNLGSQRYHPLSKKIPKKVSCHCWWAKIPFSITSDPQKGVLSLMVRKDTMSSSLKIPRRCPIIVGAQRYHYRRIRYQEKGDQSLQN